MFWILIPLAWVAVTTLVVAACQAARDDDAARHHDSADVLGSHVCRCTAAERTCPRVVHPARRWRLQDEPRVCVVVPPLDADPRCTFDATMGGEAAAISTVTESD